MKGGQYLSNEYRDGFQTKFLDTSQRIDREGNQADVRTQTVQSRPYIPHQGI
jgi:hypothetical protein